MIVAKVRGGDLDAKTIHTPAEGCRSVRVTTFTRWRRVTRGGAGGAPAGQCNQWVNDPPMTRPPETECDGADLVRVTRRLHSLQRSGVPVPLYRDGVLGTGRVFQVHSFTTGCTILRPSP